MNQDKADVYCIFDFDETLLKINSFPYVCKMIVKKSISSLSVFRLLSIALLFIQRRLHVLSHLQFKTAMMLHFEGFFCLEERKKLVAEMFKQHCNYNILSILHGCDSNVIVSTAAPEVYMSHINFGCDVILISSLSNKDYIVDISNYAAGKVLNLRAYLGGAKAIVSEFYTDDIIADSALADVALNVFVVENGVLVK
jgi:hypothetical protein